MTLKKRHLFDLGTGLFTGSVMTAHEDDLDANCPEGFAWAAGVTDWRSQRVDLDVLEQIDKLERHIDQGGEGQVLPATLDLLRARLLVDYIPPSPGDDHQYDGERKRWVLRPEVAEQRARRASTMSEIERLELQKLRPLGDLRLAEIEGRDRDPDSVARLRQIEERLAELRAELRART